MRVLIAVSSSNDGASNPLAAAVSMAWQPATEFRVLSVAEGVHPSVLQLLEGARDSAEVQRSARLAAANTVASAVAQLRGQGLTADGVTLEGDPASLITSHAAEWQADLIIAGSCDKSRLEKFFVGSVSQSVVSNAHCSVLVVKNGAD